MYIIFCSKSDIGLSKEEFSNKFTVQNFKRLKPYLFNVYFSSEFYISTY